MKSYFEQAVRDVVQVCFKSISNSFKVIGTLFFGVAGTAINLSSPFLLLQSFDILTNDNPQDDHLAYLYLASYGGLWFTNRALQSLRLILLSGPSVDLSQKLTEDVIKTYYKRPFQIRASESSAIEVQHFGNSYEHIGRNFVTASLSRVFPSITEVLAISIFLSYRYDYVAFFLGGTTLLFLNTFKMCGPFVMVSKENWNQKAAVGYGSIYKRLDQYENAIYNGNVNYELQELRKSLDDLHIAHQWGERNRELFNMLQSFVIGGGLISVLLWYGHQVHKGQIKPKDLVPLVLYLGQFSLSLDELTKALNQLRESYTSYKKLKDYLNEKHDFSDDENKIDLMIDPTRASIEFKNVSLMYPNKKTFALDNVSFKIKPGERVAIVGESGSGKTSILQLMLGFYHPTTGEITLNDQNITSVNKDSIRKAFAVIPQYPYLLNDTFFNNIWYGCQRMEAKSVSLAIEKAHLNETIEIFGDFNPIGEGGKKISGGQRQRIAIARLVLRLLGDACFAISDEATSALDSKARKIITNELFEISKGRTFVMVTHNLSDIHESKIDKVIVLDHGKIVEKGSVSKLLTKQGFFAKMIESSNINPKDLQNNNEENDDVSDIEVFSGFEENQVEIHIEDKISTGLIINEDKPLLNNANKMTLFI